MSAFDKIWLGNDSGNEGDWATAANWSPSGVPTATDSVLIPRGAPAITDGLDQSAVALGAVRFEIGFASAVGTAATRLQLDCDSFDFGGSGQAYIDLGDSGAASIGSLTGDPTVNGAHSAGDTTISVACDGDDEVDLYEGDIITFAGDATEYIVKEDVSIGNSANDTVSIFPALASALSGGEAVSIHDLINPIIRKTASASGGAVGLNLIGNKIGKLQLISGSVKIDNTSTVASVEARSGTLEIAEGVDVKTINNLGATLTCNDAVDDINNVSGTTTTEGTGAVSLIQADGGTVVSNSSGAVSTAQADAGHIDFTQSRATRTVTNASVSGTGRISLDSDFITLTNPPTSSGKMQILGAA